MLGYHSISEIPISDYLQDLRSGRTIYLVSTIFQKSSSIVYICMNKSYTIEINNV